MTTAMVETAQMWQSYVDTRDPALREGLLLQYVPLVKYVLNRMSLPMPACATYEDLVSCGTVGLIEALDRFDPSRGVNFECYAIARIKGSVVDHLRAQGLFTRSSVRAARQIEDAIACLQESLCRAPSEAELAGYLGVDLAELHRQMARVTPVIVSLDAAASGEDDDSASLVDTIVDTNSPDPESVVEQNEELELLVQALEQLPERERLVVSLYYHKALTMKEIALVMDVSESRVSQLHTQAVLRLRSSVRNQLRRIFAVA